MPDNFSPHKETKKGRMEPVDEDDVDKIVNSEVFTEMIKDKSHIFSDLGNYTSELLQEKVSDQDQKTLLKRLVKDGWVDENGMVDNKTEGKILIWKQIKKWMDIQKQRKVDALESEVEHLTLDEIKGEDLDIIKSETNKALKKAEEKINKVIELNSALKIRTNEAEQKIIRQEMGLEFLKLLAHDLVLDGCDKMNSFQIAQHAKGLMIKKHEEANKQEAGKSVKTAKDVTDNTFIKNNGLLQRMQVTALGRAVKNNKDGKPSIPLLLTFPTEGEKEDFRGIAKETGVNIRISLPKGYQNQKAYIMERYKKMVNNDSLWVKLDVRNCRPEELMSFTVQVKKSGETGSRWSTAGKVPIIPPQMWGRYSAEKKEEFIDGFIRNF